MPAAGEAAMVIGAEEPSASKAASAPRRKVLGLGAPQLPPKHDKEKNWIWGEMIDLEDNQVSCKHCPKSMSSLNSSRVKDHLLNARICGFLMYDIAKNHKDPEVNSEVRKRASTATGTSSQGGSSSNGDKRAKITDHFQKSSPAQLQQLTMLFAKMVYNTNLPFSWVEHPDVVALFKALNTNWTLPTRQKLSNQLLYAIFCTVAAEVKAAICRAPYVVLFLDGWSRSQGSNHILNFMAAIPGFCFFMDMAAANTQSCTASYMTGQVIEVIARHNLGSKLVAVVTDTLAVMKKMWAQLQVCASQKQERVPAGKVVDSRPLQTNTQFA